MQQTFATHGIYMALNANRQVAVVVAHTLCCIQYCIYIATHMFLYATNIHIRFSCTLQHGERNADVDPFVDEWRMLIPFVTYLQLFFN